MEKNKFALDFIKKPESFYLGEKKNLIYGDIGELLPSNICLYHIEEITFEDKAPRKEALENVIGSLQIGGINFVYIILGDKSGVRFYYGVAKDLNSATQAPISIFDIGEYVLSPSLKGNFRGSKIQRVGEDDFYEKEDILSKIGSMKYACYLEGVPGVNEDNENFQGVDRLVDVMVGNEFAVVVIAKPLLDKDVWKIENNLYNLYSGLTPFVKQSVQDASSENKGDNFTQTTSTSNTTGENFSTSEQIGTSTNNSETIGTSKTTTKGTSTGKSISSSSGSGTNSASNESGAEGSSENTTKGSSSNRGTTETKGTSNSKNSGESIAKGVSTSTGTSNSTTVEFVKKEAQDWIKYIDEVIFSRLDYGKGKGLFITSSVLYTQNKGNLIKLENTMKSLYSGETGNKVPLKRISLKENSYRLNAFNKFQIPMCTITDPLSENEIYTRSSLAQVITKNTAYVGNWLSTNELSLIAGLPQKEIVGLGLKEEVEFGLNITSNIEKKNQIELGNLIQSGNALKNVIVNIDKENLNKHTFITGVTGSGKTTTCQKILVDSKLPFLVIEPAKTEYRILTKKYDDLLVFTLGKDTAAPFRINPFEFFPHENITSRVDMIKASIEASFDMEAAIPQLIEAAIYECYKDFGWNISKNKNEKFQNPFDDGVYAFPTLSDLINKTDVVVSQQGFDERLKKDYIGSIKARLQGLVVGSKGLMLNTKRSINFKDLLDKKVVLELEEIRSAAEKSLIMGFVLINLIESVKAKHSIDKEFKHITLIEEAHRLLSKFIPGDSLNKKQGVETFTDMIAEVRKYGESLIIVDQIPAKLTPEVLKNTNTKIVHRIFAQDDKEAIGNTMVLSDEQKDFLSKLDTGRAIVFTQGLQKAVQVEIKKVTDTTKEEEIPDYELRKIALQYYCDTYKRGIFSGINLLDKKPKVDELEKYLELITDCKLINLYESFLVKMEVEKEFSETIKESVEQCGIDMVVSYLLISLYVPTKKYSYKQREETIRIFLQDVLDKNWEKQIPKYIDELKFRG